ncbi:MAG TPA: hypothetical protein VMV21_09890, partial [Vicinamibacteria bacterium]|nr:hypothetical protein [Vicinamibacteria bacterium]
GKGSLELIDAVGQLAPGRRALVLFTSGSHNPSALALGGPIWSWHDQTAAVLPDRAGAEEVTRFMRAFPDQPAFLVTATAPSTAFESVVRGLDRALVARVPHFGLSRLAPLVVDESFPVLVYRLGRAQPASGAEGESASGKAALP